MKCNEINELLSLYIDRMLEESQAREVEEHLSACDSCRKEYNELKEILELLGQAEMIPVPDAFRFRLKEALKEEKQNMIAAGMISKPSKKKNQWRMITSIAAIFAVGVITISMYKDVLGILPDQLNGEDQSGVLKAAEPFDALGSSGGAVDIAEAPDASSDGSVVMKKQASDSEQNITNSNLAADDSIQKNKPDSGNETGLKEESLQEDQATDYGISDPAAPSAGGDASMAADSAAPNTAAGAQEFEGKSVYNSKAVKTPEECSRALTSLGVERNAAAVQYYNNLIEEKLNGFDYQILESSYAQTGEWHFRIFIFRGKDGNTYNEEILIIGKDGKIKVICSDEFTGL